MPEKRVKLRPDMRRLHGMRAQGWERRARLGQGYTILRRIMEERDGMANERTNGRTRGMAGTASVQTPRVGGPAIILVRPQLGENIGAAARAMYNFGLDNLRLVAPRDGWPNPKAEAAAAGAREVVSRATLYEDTAAAVADLHLLFATSVRLRDMAKPVVTPAHAARRLRAALAGGWKAGLLFGAERSGLDNDDVTRAETLVRIPVNPAFGSLNLAQAVLILAYEWFIAGDDTPESYLETPGTQPAAQGDVEAFYAHLEAELDTAGFLYPPDKRPRMVRNLRNLFARAGLTDQEVRTLRGIVSALSRRNRG